MKRHISIRILSLFLALAMVLPNFQPAFALETADVTEPTSAVIEAPQETEAPAETEAAVTAPVETEPIVTEPVETEPVETEPVETEPVETEPVETEPVETEPVETEPVETEPVETEPVETEPVETEPVETEPEEAPLFPGLPEGYVLSEAELARKAELIEENILSTLANLTAGQDYAEGQITVSAASEEDAAVIAAAFAGEVIMYSHGFALIQLSDATVPEAVEASLDPEQSLPAAIPNYMSTLEPIEEVADYAPYAAELPKEQSWYSWVHENMTNPDPALTNPRSSNYQWMHDAVDTYSAWSVTTGDPWVKVAILDTGVNSSHEDLSGKVTNINVKYNGSYLGTSDIDGHGTHVAGIVAASMDNGKGGAGIAPGVSILNVRVFDSSGSCYDWYIAEGIYAAVDAGAHIINMSLGGPGSSWMLEQAIDYAVACDVTVIAAMGNVGTNSMDYPAAYDGVIAVCATDSSNSRAYFSNYGAWADISAPGQAIYSTVGSGYDSYNGTSMAAPVVAGVAALYTSAMGERVDPAVMEKVMKSSATKISGASGMGAGIVNASKMLDDKPDVPFYLIYDGEYFYDAKKTVPCDATLYLYESEEVFMNDSDDAYGDQNSVFLYTLDGTNPSIKNGEVVNGYLVGDSALLKLESYAGSTVTLKIARVSGMGIVGKTLTLKLKVGTGDYVTGVSIQGPSRMVAGKSTTLTATVSPESADQSVTWDIYGLSYSMYGASINAKTGKLTTPAGKSGTIQVIAISNVDPSYYAIHEISVAHVNPVSQITLNYSSFTCYTGYYFDLSIYRMTDTYGRSIDPADAGIKWTSSNPKVAEVDQNGRVYCYTKGSVTITCQALDGSNKKATCKLQVRQAVEEITITGQKTIAKGASATYKATVAPKDAYAKKVTWSLSGAPYGVTISSSGKVTVPNYVSNGTSFKVVAASTDDFGVYTSYTVTVVPKCTGVYIGVLSGNTDTGYAQGPALGAALTSNAYRVKSVELFSLDMDHSSGVDNGVQLSGFYSGRNDSYGFASSWTSSNPSVASVDQYGYVTAHKAGTAKITYAALDGSNKKATVTVKVTNPASTISISTSAPRMLSNSPYVAFGKSVTNKAVFADTYGVPTNQKVNWRFSVYELDEDGNAISNWTNYFQRYKLVTLSNSGKLSVSSKVYNEWLHIDGEFVVNVYATAADGSGASGSITYKLIRPTSYMSPDQKTYYVEAGSTFFAYVWADQWPHLGASFTATSSNPGVVSLYEDNSFPSIYCYDYDYNYQLGLYRVYLVAPKSGTAKITVKAADGSNKSCTFTVKVY